MNFNKLAILGSGSMGTAILAGLMRRGVDASEVVASTKTQATASRLSDEFGITAIATETNAAANVEAVVDADIVLLAVKPAYIIEVLTQVAESLKPGALVISVAAGISTAAMQAAVPENVAVVRAMPNTPAIVGRAVTGLAAGSKVTPEQLATASELFESVGRVVVVGEDQIDQLSTVSGSGPAYVFYFIEEFTKAAVELGFTPDQARMLVEETFLGASELLAASGKAPADLRRQVTSPNGTTMQAIAVFEQANLSDLFARATAAALARAREIAAGK
ncbi:MAG: pyrroline-5-carboxylate reductase [Micrococcales bacterium]